MTEIRIEGLDKYIGKLSNPTVIEVPAKAFMEEATSIGRKAAVDAISAGTGLAERTIAKKVETFRGEVYSAMDQRRANSIEFGRKVGEYVPFMAIVQWIEGDPYLYHRKNYVVSRETYGATLKIQDAIIAGGTRGKAFIGAALIAVAGEMPRLEAEMAKKIEEKLSGA